MLNHLLSIQFTVQIVVQYLAFLAHVVHAENISQSFMASSLTQTSQSTGSGVTLWYVDIWTISFACAFMELLYLLRKVDSSFCHACKDYVLMGIDILSEIEGKVKQEDKLAIEYVS